MALEQQSRERLGTLLCIAGLLLASMQCSYNRRLGVGSPMTDLVVLLL